MAQKPFHYEENLPDGLLRLTYDPEEHHKDFVKLTVRVDSETGFLLLSRGTLFNLALHLERAGQVMDRHSDR